MKHELRFDRFPKVASNGLVAATLLAFVATAGLFYVNIMAAIVDGLIGGMGLTEAQAGNIGSVNIYGASVGALLAVFLVGKFHWRIMMVFCLVLMIAIDFTSMAVRSADVLLLVRLMHGVLGGLSVGVGLAVIARTINPDRTFGMLLFVQFGLGGLGVMTLPNLVPIYGTAPLFIALALFSLVTLFMLPFLPEYPPTEVKKPLTDSGKVDWKPYILSMMAVFVFQASNMALLAYIIRLGVEFDLERLYVSSALGIATWVALLGPLAVIWLGGRYGRFKMLALAMVLTLVGNAFFHFSGQPAIYLLANCATGITWGFVMPYLFGVASEFDEQGRTAAFAGVISKLGLATGPLVAGQLLGAGGDFHLLINWVLAGLFIAMVLMLIPAWSLDRSAAAAKKKVDLAP